MSENEEIKHSPDARKTQGNEYAALGAEESALESPTLDTGDRVRLHESAGAKADLKLSEARANLRHVETSTDLTGEAKYAAWEAAMAAVDAEKAKSSTAPESGRTQPTGPAVLEHATPTADAPQTGAQNQGRSAEAPARAGRSSAYRIPLTERPGFLPRAEQMLAGAQAKLARIESGEEVPEVGIHAGWEQAKRAVESNEAMIVALKSDELDDSPLPVRHRRPPSPDSDRGSDDRQRRTPDRPQHISRSAGEQVLGSEQLDAGQDYIKEPPRRYSYDGPDEADKFRPHANEVATHMLADPAFAKEVQARKGFGRNRTEAGVSEIMAAYALPFLKRAQRAETLGWHARADTYRQEASDAANDAARAILAEESIRSANDSDVDILAMSGGGWVTQRAPRRPRDMMRARSFLAGRGISPKALRVRKNQARA